MLWLNQAYMKCYPVYKIKRRERRRRRRVTVSGCKLAIRVNDCGIQNRPFRKIPYTLCLSPQILHKHCFQFSLGLTMIPRENKNNVYAKFAGTNKEYCGIFRNGLYYFSFIEDRKSSTSNNKRGAFRTFSCCN